jgi:hypothetical protein
MHLHMRRSRVALAAVLLAGTSVGGALAGGGTTTIGGGTSTTAHPTTPKKSKASVGESGKIVLTPAQDKRSVPFGLDRDAKTITLTYTAAKPIAAGAAIDVVFDANLGLIAVDISAPDTADAAISGSARAETVPRPV